MAESVVAVVMAVAESVVVVGMAVAVVARRCNGDVTIMNITRNSKSLDAKTSTRHDEADSNSTMQN